MTEHDQGPLLRVLAEDVQSCPNGRSGEQSKYVEAVHDFLCSHSQYATCVQTHGVTSSLQKGHHTCWMLGQLIGRSSVLHRGVPCW